MYQITDSLGQFVDEHETSFRAVHAVMRYLADAIDEIYGEQTQITIDYPSPAVCRFIVDSTIVYTITMTDVDANDGNDES